jgi:hypothetical protein
MLRTLPLLVLALAACDRKELRATVGEVELSTAALHFGRTYVGFPGVQSLVLQNRGRSDRRVSFTSTPPFEVEGEVTVAGGSQRAVEVKFNPLSAADAVGTLAVSSEQGTVEVALDGTGVSPLVCTASSPCATSAFDAVAGSCVESNLADGSPCSSLSACILGGSCTGGVCLGTAVDCSDSNPCTVDACESGGGCVHFARACAAPADPCKVASCDPVRGCVEADAQDGTACGPADCVSARVCMLGSCKTLPVPDGATCSSASPCQDKGTCHQHRCEQPSAHPLTELWSYPFQDPQVSFAGVTDSAENLYWIECAFGGIAGSLCNACTRCAATSYTRDGALRFQHLLFGVPEQGQPAKHLLIGTHLVYALLNKLGSVSTSGADEWTSTLAMATTGAARVATRQWVQAMAADSVGTAHVLIARELGPSLEAMALSTALVRIEPATGTVLRVQYLGTRVRGLVVDEFDNLYFAELDELVSLNPSGAERWRVLAPGVTPSAVYNGALILADGQVRSSVNGSAIAPALARGTIRNALMSAAGRTLLTPPLGNCCEGCDDCGQQVPSVTAIAFAQGGTVALWQQQIAWRLGGSSWALVSETAASAQGDLLVATTTENKPPSLRALTSAGATRFDCPLSAPTALGGIETRFVSPVALLDGRWASVETEICPACTKQPPPRLRMFDVPGESPAKHGWVGARGGPSGSARPLP